MQRILHTITLLYTLTFLLWVPLQAASVTQLSCIQREQLNPIESPWKCPTLGVKMETVLSDVDVESGKYTCEYYYPDSGQMATACTYISKNYKDKLENTVGDLHNEIVNAFKGGGTMPDYKDYYMETIGDVNPLELIDEAKDELSSIYELAATEKTNTTKMFKKVEEMVSGGNKNPANLSAPHNLQGYFHLIEDADGYLMKLNLTKVKNPKQALLKSYGKFVKPYTPSGGGKREEKTFSTFITGLVTLDNDVIKGFSDKNGSLLVIDKWKNVSTSPTIFKAVADKLVQHSRRDSNSSHELNTDTYNVQGWISIFTQKIWGFYYNLQRRLDLGYDIISTQLLFIMMVFFAMSMAARGGARYITNRENGHSSGEIKINEASIMKTLGILATVFAFYISVPTKNITSDISNTGEMANLNQHEMRTNSSLAKEFIRYAMNRGAVFGTMMSDLGTDAFLHYIVHKQGLDNSERGNVIESMLTMAYYFPAKQIVNTCRMQSALPDGMGASGANSVSISQFFQEHYKDDIPFTHDNSDTDTQMVGVSDSLCRKMYALTNNKLREVLFNFTELNEMIKKDMYVRLEATYSLVENHIKLQEALGWMNIASVPYTYFMMKNQHLFFESSLDYDKIEKESEDFVNNLGIRNMKDTLDDTLWAKHIEATRSRVIDAKQHAENSREEYTRMAAYNFLPGFTSIRNEILQRIQSLYSDILRLSRNNNPSKLTRFEEFLTNMINKSQEFYSDLSGLEKNFLNKLKNDIHRGIGDMKNNTQDPVTLHIAFLKVSYLVALSIWKSGFVIIFLSAIAMIVGLKIVLYIINVMIHFFISPFIVVWAFATSTDGGMGKIKNYLRDTLIYMLYPTIIVIGVFIFIFAYELFYSIYGFITSMLIEGQFKGVEQGIMAASGAAKAKDAEMSYLAIYSLKDITEILIDLLSVYVAFLTINKFPELVLKMMGVSDSAVVMLPQASEAIQSKGGGSVNPLSR